MFDWISKFARRRRWKRTISLLLLNPRMDWMEYSNDIYMYKEAKAIGRGIVEAKKVLFKIDSSRPRLQTLKQAKLEIHERLEVYRSFPYSEGEWECAVLSQIEDRLDQIIKQETDQQ